MQYLKPYLERFRDYLPSIQHHVDSFRELSPLTQALIGGTTCALLYGWYWLQPGTCYSKARLDGKITIITGANTGIGKETAKDFALRGATVIMACRDLSRGEKAAVEVRSETGAPADRILVRQLDLGSLKSVKKFAEGFLKEFSKLHILVNNAGVMMCPYTLTEDGFEQQFGVNHLGHFALTNLLLPVMKNSGKARIVNLSSNAHSSLAYCDFDDLLWEKNVYINTLAYGQSKLFNVLFTKELHKRLADTGITAYALHPGVVNTELIRHYPIIDKIIRCVFPFFAFFRIYILKTPKDGAQTSIYCGVQEGIDNLSGEYFADCARKKSHKWTYEADRQAKLWEISEKLSGISYPF